MFQLRPYQQAAVDAAFDWLKVCLSPCCLELATAAGKSFILAALAHKLHKASGKKVLVLAPNAEIVKQNREKYLLTGEPASMFSASAGAKDLKHPVVFGSPLTVKNNLKAFERGYCAVFIDECHLLTNSIKDTIEHMRVNNPKLRVVGVSGTPYRLGTGYIYADHYVSGPTNEDNSIEPYFAKLVYSIPAKQLIDEGFLTPPTTVPTDNHYDTSGLTINRMGKFDSETVTQAFEGQGRKTAQIVADVVEKTRNRMAVMLFAATRQHAREIMESLPPELSAMVTGETKKKDREKIIQDTRDMKVKYLVSVGALTTGVDIPSVDTCAILRATESVSLYQQIVGRSLRLHDEKQDALILDYAGNIDSHFPDGDLFAPEIRANRKGETAPINCHCEQCGYQNEFSARQNPDSLPIDANGYFTDLAGERIMIEASVQQKDGSCETMYKPLPAHYGRRCTGMSLNRITHTWDRCTYQWSSKDCPDCGHSNDIAARYCKACKAEIVNPNEKLREEAAKLAADPYATQMMPVESMMISRNYGVNGRADTLKVEFFIEEKPHKLTAWYAPDSQHNFAQRQYKRFSEGSFGAVVSLDNALDLRTAARKPTMIAFRKKQDSKYYEVSNVFYEIQ